MTDDPRQLVVLLGGHRVGTVTMDVTGRLALAYDPEWLTDPQAVPVSLSMPLVQRAHDDGPTRAYLSGLLPDNERVLERWGRDYHVSPGQPLRCQSMGILPTSKYQNEGGPTPEQIVQLLRTNVLPPAAGRDAVDVFVDALAFNWLIGGSDAHAKNYSLLLAAGAVRLAPLYDLASALAYDEIHRPRLAMAMKIGGEYRVAAVAGRHWRRFAGSVGLDPSEPSKHRLRPASPSASPATPPSAGSALENEAGRRRQSRSSTGSPVRSTPVPSGMRFMPNSSFWSTLR
ncbi:MAG TPA: HipA domain-containing protein [Rugosimonospora sp.]|nr:HipA domain-containing protein [Rugosimonospora sp.]